MTENKGDVAPNYESHLLRAVGRLLLRVLRD